MIKEWLKNKLYNKKIEELELSVRSMNCLKNDNIIYIGDLVQKTEAEMLRTPNFGRKSLIELREILESGGIKFGVKFKETEIIYESDSVATVYLKKMLCESELSRDKIKIYQSIQEQLIKDMFLGISAKERLEGDKNAR
jgi:hypothetical protein|tara:strand:+ start:102 stop:518 length:417 start_codon:yes stop_codon:yes gene_type:complete